MDLSFGICRFSHIAFFIGKYSDIVLGKSPAGKLYFDNFTRLWKVDFHVLFEKKNETVNKKKIIRKKQVFLIILRGFLFKL